MLPWRAPCWLHSHAFSEAHNMMAQFIVSTHGGVRYLCVEVYDYPLRAWEVVRVL